MASLQAVLMDACLAQTYKNRSSAHVHQYCPAFRCYLLCNSRQRLLHSVSHTTQGTRPVKIPSLSTFPLNSTPPLAETTTIPHCCRLVYVSIPHPITSTYQHCRLPYVGYLPTCSDLSGEKQPVVFTPSSLFQEPLPTHTRTFLIPV